MKTEIDDTVLLKIDWALKQALLLLRGPAQGVNIDTTIDDLSDAVCRISEKVRQIKGL
jgi:hypothetical protein